MYSALENCLVKRADGTPHYISMEVRPIYDETKYSGKPFPTHRCSDGTIILWDNYMGNRGHVIRTSPDGTITEWFDRPTWQTCLYTTNLAENPIFGTGFLTTGNYTKFNADGSVFQKIPYSDGDSSGVLSWFWGAQTVKAEPLEIEVRPWEDCGCRMSRSCCGDDNYEPGYSYWSR